MHNLFRSKSPFVVIILFILALVMKLQALSHPAMPQAFPHHLLFGSLLHFLQFSAFGYTILAVILTFLQSVYVNFICEKHKLFHKTGYYAAFIYLVLSSLYPAFSYFSEPLLINWFVLIALDVMLSFSKTLEPQKQLFNAGFFICIPVLLQFPAIGFFVLLLVALLLLRSYRVSEMVVTVLGYFTPAYFFVGILYLIDKTSFLKNVIEIGFDMHLLSASRIYLAGIVSGVLLMVIGGVYAFQQSSIRMTIYVRRSWFLIFCYLAVAITVTLLAVSAVHAEWVLVVPPLSLIISQVLYIENNRRLSTFMFYFSLALLIFAQITFK
ncbi:MAG TPA: DUF6427 family protein [Flavipsychrobacter sp.]|nr:DUF6427 family protein [Flavipsychrobacter sp.]